MEGILRSPIYSADSYHPICKCHPWPSKPRSKRLAATGSRALSEQGLSTSGPTTPDSTRWDADCRGATNMNVQSTVVTDIEIIANFEAHVS